MSASAAHRTKPKEDASALEQDALKQYKAQHFDVAAKEFQKAARLHDDKALALEQSGNYGAAATEHESAAVDLGNRFEATLHDHTKHHSAAVMVTLLDLQRAELEEAERDKARAKSGNTTADDKKSDEPAEVLLAKRKAMSAIVAHEAQHQYAAVVDDLFDRVEAERRDTNHPPTKDEIAKLEELANAELDRAEAEEKAKNSGGGSKADRWNAGAGHASVGAGGHGGLHAQPNYGAAGYARQHDEAPVVYDYPRPANGGGGGCCVIL